MERKFCDSWLAARKTAEGLGVRMRPPGDDVMKEAHRCLSGHRESDGFFDLAKRKRLDLSLEALAVKKPYIALFSDEEANNALMRLRDAGFGF